MTCSLPHIIHTDSTQYKQLQNSILSITSDHANVWVYICVLFESNIPVPLKFMLILLRYSGADPGFQVRGAHLKNLLRAEGGTKMFGVFRVKNHDFSPKNHIFSNFRGVGGRHLPLDPPLVFKSSLSLNHWCNIVRNVTCKLSFELKSNGTHSEVVNKPQYPIIAADPL